MSVITQNWQDWRKLLGHKQYGSKYWQQQIRHYQPHRLTHYGKQQITNTQQLSVEVDMAPSHCWCGIGI